MKKELDFTLPFWKWGGLGFQNCYASVYMCLQGISENDYYYSSKDGYDCNNCSNCSEKLNFLFQTISGQTIARKSWSGELTKIQKEIENEFGNAENTSDKFIDIVFGFTGYDYKIINDNFKESVEISINAGKPVIVRLIKDEIDNNLGSGFRVITGYDGDEPIEPDYTAVAKIEKRLAYNEIKCLYLLGDKIPQRYSFLDVLKFMERVMNSDFEEGVWYDFLRKIETSWGIDDAEAKTRFDKFSGAAWWTTLMANSLQNAFCIDDRLKKQFGMDNQNCLWQLYKVVAGGLGCATDILHNRGYQAGALNNGIQYEETTDSYKWDKNLIFAAEQTLESIIECDYQILSALKKAIRKFSE
jgi:hypothetical protein